MNLNYFCTPAPGKLQDFYISTFDNEIKILLILTRNNNNNNNKIEPNDKKKYNNYGFKTIIT